MDLWAAAKAGDVERLRQLLQQGANVHQTRWSGFTALHRACEFGHLDCAVLLLEQGADVNARSSWGWYAPLHLALGNGHVEVGIMLLSRGARKECRDKYGKTAFQRAVKLGQADAAAQVREQQQGKSQERSDEVS